MSLDTLKLEFSHSVKEMELILAGLQKLPMEAVVALYTKLHASAKKQVDDHLANQSVEVPADSITVTSEGNPAPAESTVSVA
jgi:aspartyl-tRNA synthetase